MKIKPLSKMVLRTNLSGSNLPPGRMPPLSLFSLDQSDIEKLVEEQCLEESFCKDVHTLTLNYDGFSIYE